MARAILARGVRECRPCVASLGVFAAAVVALLFHKAADDPAALAAATGGAVGCALVLAASLANLSRVAMGIDGLWSAVLLLSALGTQTVLITAFAPDATLSPTAGLLADLSVLCCALVMVALATRLRVEPPPLLVGGMLGLSTTSPFLLAPLNQISWAAPVQAGLSVLVAAGYVAVALTVLQQWPWGRASRFTIAVALLVLGMGRGLEPHAQEADWLGVLSGLDHLVAAALLSIPIYVAVNSGFSAERRRLTILREQVLEAEEAMRQTRQERHELLNMVAGISLASELLVDEEEVEEPVRRRLEHSIHDEALQVRALLEAGRGPLRDGSGRHPAPPASTLTRP